VVVYTYEADAKQVRKALGLKVQNYLIKPFNDQPIYDEIAKAERNPWRNLYFEDAKSFCSLMNLTAEQLQTMRREVMVAYDEAAQRFPAWAENRQNEEVFAQINSLVANAEAAGVWAGVDFLRDLLEQATIGNWSAFHTCSDNLSFASKLIFCQLNPSYSPDCMHGANAEAEAGQAAERARWERADVDAHGPVLDLETLQKQVDALGGCPVIDTVAAAFQMNADGRAASMTNVMDLASRDPGLCAEVLIAASQVNRDDMTAIEDPRTAAGLLGEMKLHALAKALPTAEEQYMELPPLTWPNYWMFQVAVGRLAQFICTYLDFEYLGANAYTAGLLHDLGKLFLLKLHPFGFQAIVRYARERKVTLRAAEQKYLGCTSRDLAVHFATTKGLPNVYANVLRWVEEPEQATDHVDLIAMVSLARHVCLHAHVGMGGDTPVVTQAPIRTTAAWRVLQPRLFPSFDAKKFETQAHAYCMTLRAELSGERRVSQKPRAAELV
jgi:HD-like signal output (HDOD) protein